MKRVAKKIPASKPEAEPLSIDCTFCGAGVAVACTDLRTKEIRRQAHIDRYLRVGLAAPKDAA